MFETKYEWFITVVLALVVIMFFLFPKTVIKEIPIEVVKEVPVEVTKIVEVAQSCPPCTTIVKEIIREECPEKKCICSTMGGWRE